MHFVHYEINPPKQDSHLESQLKQLF